MTKPPCDAFGDEAAAKPRAWQITPSRLQPPCRHSWWIGGEARRGEAGVAAAVHAAGVGRHTQRNWDAPRMLRPCGGYPQCAMQGRRWAREYQDAFFVRTPPNSFPQSQQFFSLHAGHCLSAPLNMHRDVWNSGKKCEHSGEKCSSTNLIAYLDGPDKQCWACTCCIVLLFNLLVAL